MSFSCINLFVVIARFIRVIQSGFHSLLDYRDKPDNDMRRHTDENRYPEQSRYWISVCAGMTNSAEAG
ncbi:MAG: hypothetical protein COA84_02060 [Robiginitomaculum sp.]|nr:MAG: hypothetical protein COA84_02060 [Robiginitomaculum sp.]